jgi:HD-GYP domain-containing protein (c-di-GMP phosphodiesterase class II)
MTMAVGGEGFEVAGHCEEGEKIVAGANFPDEVASAVRHHHDRWDGSGEQIPLMARILAITERYESMTAGRGRPRVAGADAAAEIAKASGTEFDPAVVEALNRAVQDRSLELNLPDLALPAVGSPPLPVAVS